MLPAMCLSSRRQQQSSSFTVGRIYFSHLLQMSTTPGGSRQRPRLRRETQPILDLALRALIGGSTSGTASVSTSPGIRSTFYFRSKRERILRVLSVRTFGLPAAPPTIPARRVFTCFREGSAQVAHREPRQVPQPERSAFRAG